MLSPATIALLNITLVAAVSLNPRQAAANGEEPVADSVESDESTKAAE